jgi:hypothetical protein
MPTTNVNAVTPFNPLSGTPAANAADLPMTAGDPSNSNSTTSRGNKDFLLAQNTHASNPYNISITGVMDPFGATLSITNYAMQAQDIAMFAIPRQRFLQPSGTDAGKYVYTVENAAVKVCPLDIV